MVPKSGMMRIAKPEGWDEIIEYTKKTGVHLGK